MSGLSKARSVVFKNATPILLAIFAVFVVVKMPVFFTPDNLISLSSQGAIWGLAAIGMTMLIITGVTDVSVGSQIYLGGVITVRVFQATESMVLGLLCSILVCMAVSAFNGFAIVKVGLPSMITTLSSIRTRPGRCISMDMATIMSISPQTAAGMSGQQHQQLSI